VQCVVPEELNDTCTSEGIQMCNGVGESATKELNCICDSLSAYVILLL
jgi:hypothetical protein